MKKNYLAIGFIGLLIILFGVVLYLRRDEDTWVCVDGQWVEHGNPSASMPATPCEK